MDKRVIGAFAAALLLASVLVAGVLTTGSEGAEAQVVDARYEYGYLLAVDRLEGYEIDLDRWAAPKGGKTFMREHVFPYEIGTSEFDRRLNGLKKLNELSSQGWEIVDAQEGLLRRMR